MTRSIAITNESAWLVETNDEGTSGHVIARASFGYHMPNEHQYTGPILSGPDGISLRPGGRLVFECYCRGDHVGWRDNTVTSGVINRVVNFDDVPKADPVQDILDPDTGEVIGQSIVFNPGWGLLRAWVPQNPPSVKAEFEQALRLADLLSILVRMGRLTQEDLQAAEDYGL